MLRILALASDPSNAAPEWQARSYCYRSRLYGGLSTPGACSKVSHLHRQRLQTYTAPAELKSPPLHFPHWWSTSAQGPRRTSRWCQSSDCVLQTRPCRGSPWKALNLWPPGPCAVAHGLGNEGSISILRLDNTLPSRPPSAPVTGDNLCSITLLKSC